MEIMFGVHVFFLLSAGSSSGRVRSRLPQRAEGAKCLSVQRQACLPQEGAPPEGQNHPEKLIAGSRRRVDSRSKATQAPFHMIQVPAELRPVALHPVQCDRGHGKALPSLLIFSQGASTTLLIFSQGASATLLTLTTQPSAQRCHENQDTGGQPRRDLRLGLSSNARHGATRCLSDGNHPQSWSLTAPDRHLSARERKATGAWRRRLSRAGGLSGEEKATSTTRRPERGGEGSAGQEA